jgi:hypothetical protein
MPNNNPIICTLSPRDVAKRGPRWKDALRDAGALVTDAPGGIAATFQSAERFAELEELIRAEQQCCAWMNFEVVRAENGVVLSVTSDSSAGHHIIREMMK